MLASAQYARVSDDAILQAKPLERFLLQGESSLALWQTLWIPLSSVHDPRFECELPHMWASMHVAKVAGRVIDVDIK